MIAIVAAMPEELAPLVARARAPRTMSPPARPPFKLLTAELAGKSVALVVTGDGERNARLGAEALLATLSVRRVIVIGIAGAASDELAPGDLVVADQVASEAAFEAGSGWRADASSVEVAVRRTGARAAHVVSVKDIADSVAAKRRLAAGRGAAALPVAVDLESATYIAAAVEAGLPWSVLRVISDAAHEALPPLLNRARDGGGAIRRGAVAFGLLGDPGALPVLLRMRTRLRDASVRLADAVERVLLAS